MKIKRYKVIYSDIAYQDLNNIYNYIYFNLHNPQAASSITTAIRKTVDSLNTFPERNEIMSDEPWHSLNIRKEPVRGYLIAYQISENQTVSVIRIFYGGQNIR